MRPKAESRANNQIVLVEFYLKLTQIADPNYFSTYYWTLHFNKIARIELSFANFQLFTRAHQFLKNFDFLIVNH